MVWTVPVREVDEVLFHILLYRPHVHFGLFFPNQVTLSLYLADTSERDNNFDNEQTRLVLDTSHTLASKVVKPPQLQSSELKMCKAAILLCKLHHNTTTTPQHHNVTAVLPFHGALELFLPTTTKHLVRVGGGCRDPITAADTSKVLWC